MATQNLLNSLQVMAVVEEHQTTGQTTIYLSPAMFYALCDI